MLDRYDFGGFTDKNNQLLKLQQELVDKVRSFEIMMRSNVLVFDKVRSFNLHSTTSKGRAT